MKCKSQAHMEGAKSNETKVNWGCLNLLSLKNKFAVLMWVILGVEGDFY